MKTLSLQPHLGTHERQYNVAFLGVGLQYYCHSQNAHKSKRKDTIGIQIHPEVLELQENVAYQRPSELRECSDFSVYEIVG